MKVHLTEKNDDCLFSDKDFMHIIGSENVEFAQYYERNATISQELTNNLHREGIPYRQLRTFCATLSPEPRNKKIDITSVNQ